MGEDEKQRIEVEKERERRRTDTNYNPLLKNGITNRDIFRTLVFHYRTDGFLQVKEAAKFVNDLLKRPILTPYDQEAEDRFIASLERNLARFSKDNKIYED